MTTPTSGGDGRNRLFRDSKFGVAVTAVSAVVIDNVLSGLIENISNVDTSGWNGWWVTTAAGVLAGVGGLLTAYKARRDERRSGFAQGGQITG